MDRTAAIHALLRRHGLRAGRVHCVAKLGCEIHRISPVRPHGRTDLPAGADLALRIYPDWMSDRTTVHAELTWLQALADEGLHTPRPLADCDGIMLHPWPAEHGQQPRLAALLTWLPGRVLDKGLRPMHLRRVGELTARMHRVAEHMRDRGQLQAHKLADQPDLAAWAHGARGSDARLSPTTRATLCSAAAALQAAQANLPRDAGSFGWIHGDLHPWNLLFRGTQAGAIDFSDCGLGHHAQDLAATLQYLRHPWVSNHDPGSAYPAMEAQLLEGYAHRRCLPANASVQIDLFIACRKLNTVEWILDQWPRVDHRPWGPAFLNRVGTALAAWAAA